MREFLVYTALRLALLLGTFALVSGIWIGIAGEFNWFWALIIAFLLSGIASYVLLNGPRQAFAAKVDQRAANALEKMRSKED